MNESDHELLELAAKAAGYKLADYQDREAKTGLWLARGYENPVTGSRDWNPLTDDGDALRLAVKLQLQITPGTYNKDEFSAFHAGLGEAHEYWSPMQDEYAAARRAIVRAAAEIGKSLA